MSETEKSLIFKLLGLNDGQFYAMKVVIKNQWNTIVMDYKGEILCNV